MILVLDHYDSFVYNLVQLVEGFGYETRVVRSDEAGANELAASRPAAVILSPGPGRPESAGCFLEMVKLLDQSTPVLGVCLGHQAIGAAFGGPVVRAPEPVHGKASLIYHEGRGILEGLPSPFEAGRYHSLVVDRATIPDDLVVTAETQDGLVMAVEHRTLPRYGVQFHPESILTPFGPQIVENFLELVNAPARSV
ncbi:MAG TPA: aminodeoxychorismate/anthranilate synthase component II [Actinomycetota bacterium]|nr:aminodeoxychorismate/anthranilate synthase component II [Actinomycetota bacterium]